MSNVNVRAPAPNRIIWDGQSMNEVPAGATIPIQTMHNTGVPWVEIGIGGTGWGALTPTIKTRRDPQAAGLGTSVLVMNGGQSDILADSVTGAVAYQRAKDYRDSAYAAGFDVIIGVTYPNIGPNPWPGGALPLAKYTAMTDHNTLMLADSANWDAIIDLAAVLTDGSDTDLYLFDQIHLSAAGAAIGAAACLPVLAPWLT